MSERIVVGVDGSEASRSATQWAAREARLRGAELLLLSAWEMPTHGFGYGMSGFSDELMKGLMQAAENTVAAAREEVGASSNEITVETKAVEGQAANVLVAASKDADLLVVGSRGMGGFRDLLLGSVSGQCADHASCPVVIVRQMPEEA